MGKEPNSWIVADAMKPFLDKALRPIFGPIHATYPRKPVEQCGTMKPLLDKALRPITPPIHESTGKSPPSPRKFRPTALPFFALDFTELRHIGRPIPRTGRRPARYRHAARRRSHGMHRPAIELPVDGHLDALAQFVDGRRKASIER